MNAYSIRLHIASTLDAILMSEKVEALMSDQSFVAAETDRVLTALYGIDEGDSDAVSTALQNYSIDLGNRMAQEHAAFLAPKP